MDRVQGFKGLKGFSIDSFLDSKIAEEEARQKKSGQPSGSPRRSPSNAPVRRTSGRTDSPARRAGNRLRVPEGGSVENAGAGKGPDPEEFVIGDDASDISRAATPRPVKETAEGPLAEEGKKTQQPDDAPPVDKGKEKAEDELPEDVRKKLARLESLTAKYQGMLATTPLHRDWHLLFYSQNSLCIDLLRNYRTAHKRVAAIEPFESTLREHTPLTSIEDPGALVEFLHQRSLQSDMVLEELKRVTGEHKDVVRERDELKVKLDDAEKKAKDAFDEAAGLRKEQEEKVVAANTAEHAQETSDEPPKPAESDPLGADSINESQPSKSAQSSGTQIEATDETFFSYETELPRLEAEVKKHQEEANERLAYINELETENATHRQGNDMIQLDLSAMKNKLSVKDREIAGIKAELAETQGKLEEAATERTRAQEEQEEAADMLVRSEAQLQDFQERLKESQKELEEKAKFAEENLRKYQEVHKKNLNSGAYVQRDEKMKEVHNNVVNALKKNVQEAEDAKKAAENKVNDLNFEIKQLEATVSSSGEVIARLRRYETTVERVNKELDEIKDERDNALRLAETKKGHEAAAASLRSQLKRAEKDRDAAYQMILDCGKCKIPDNEDLREPETSTEHSRTPDTRSRGGSEATEVTEVSTQPTEISTPSAPSVDGEIPANGDAKKKKKKKSKSKKKGSIDATATPSIDELIAEPQKAKDMIDKHGDSNTAIEFMKQQLESIRAERETQDDGRENVIKHLEGVVEEREQAIRDSKMLMREKEDEITALHHKIGKQEEAIERLDKKLKDQEGLQEEIETLKDSLTDQGEKSTTALHDLKTLREEKQRLQDEFDELQVESDRHRKGMKDAEAQREDLTVRCTSLETEITELKNAQTSASSAEKQRLDQDFRVMVENITNMGKQIQADEEKTASLEKEKESLQIAKDACEKQIEELKAQHTANGAELDAKHQSLTADFDELKSKATGLEKDLNAANHLAQTRYKDLTDLREHLNKVQPELKKLREESEQLRVAKTDLEKANAIVKRLESKERDLRSEITEYKSQATEKDKEVGSLKDQAKRSDERSTALEDTCERARKDLEQNERTRDEAVDARDRLQSQLEKAQDEMKGSKSRLDDLEKQVKKFSDEAASLRDELQLKAAQQASSQSLMTSMQDGNRELATQMKEASERCESLEEELADAHRLLSERSREGETMRRLLADVESRADSRVREMREKMDLATEERDRAEDEASNIGRRKAREIEDLKNRLRDAEQEAGSASAAKEDAERRERDFKGRHEDLERRTAQAQEEVTEVRSAMAQLRDALDEGERQSRDLEKERADLRKALEEREARLEKLQKSSRSMADEMRTLQTNKLRQGSMQSSRSSMESSRVTSPAPRIANGSTTNFGTPLATTGGPDAREAIDYVYLKNVLLQFLEQREKKHQMQLVPVLGMLLHFDK